MGLSIYNIKRWIKMLSGKSIYHVSQNPGKIYSVDSISGYYNDLTKKVLMGDENIENGIPYLIHRDGRHIQMPTMIFQYGLGAYDLWLLSEKKEKDYLLKAQNCALWGIENQNSNGAWDNFSYYYPEHPFSAMSQGEGVSLLLRIYAESHEKKYFDAAQMAIEFMLKSIEDGGVCDMKNDALIFLEYSHRPAVLNGWIFAFWGLLDYYLVTRDKKYQELVEHSLDSIIKYLPSFSCDYWSMYDLSGRITSPFYHDLQIAQMKVMYVLTNNQIFGDYAVRWEANKTKLISRTRSFVRKSIQKVLEKE